MTNAVPLLFPGASLRQVNNVLVHIRLHKAEAVPRDLARYIRAFSLQSSSQAPKHQEPLNHGIPLATTRQDEKLILCPNIP